uniref:Asparagine synthetase domain-containing protein n=1 Tax=Syphacia muris TaxID=451379 RepID=A0A0N5AJR9_9BILA
MLLKENESAGTRALTQNEVFEQFQKFEAAIEDLFTKLHGSWAFVYCIYDLKKVFIGRDIYGKKSFLWSRYENQLIISPLITNKGLWNEIPSGTLSVVNLCNIWEDMKVVSPYSELSSPWTCAFGNVVFSVSESLHKKMFTLNRKLLHETEIDDLLEVDAFIKNFSHALQRCLVNFNNNTDSIAVLFSGGIDSLLIAVLLEPLVQQNCVIDLINVAFGKKPEDFFKAPDRIRATKAYFFLRDKFPKIRYRLLLVNVTEEELSICRSKYIAALIAPSCSVLDDSIGCVQWFAARGEGLLFEEGKETNKLINIRSTAKIAFVGSGADEIFGGYMRHRNCYIRDGRNAALDEMEKELRIIGERNLGRDDRVTAFHERKMRAPYLDDLFVCWALNLPLEVKADFTKPRGIGEKKIIRHVLKNFGAPKEIYMTPKQAMQFGTRIAHLEKANEKGNDICTRLISSAKNAI